MTARSNGLCCGHPTAAFDPFSPPSYCRWCEEVNAIARERDTLAARVAELEAERSALQTRIDAALEILRRPIVSTFGFYQRVEKVLAALLTPTPAPPAHPGE